MSLTSSFTKALMLAAVLATSALAQTFTDFRFSATQIGWGEDLVGTIDNTNRTVTFTTQRWIENINQLRAIYTLDNDAQVTVGSTQQISGTTANDFRKDVIYKIGDDTYYTVTFESPQATGLPVIRIDTKGGVGITSKTTYVNMDFRLEHPTNPILNVTKTDGYADSIRGRGNSTWSWPKKPYRIKFDKNTSLFGLPATKSWVLLAEYADVTLLKNAFAFELGDRLGIPYNHTYRHVELYLNGKYNGTYTLTEQNQVNPGRVDIDKNDGWLIEQGWRYDEEPKFRTTNYNLPIMIKSPEPDGPVNMTNPAYKFVENDWNELCDLMASADFPENDYRELIDAETFIQYFLVQLVTNNGDGQGLSIYFYKDKDKKISAGPLWDFDLSFNSTVGQLPGIVRKDYNNEYTIIPYFSNGFFNRFFQDPIFRAKWKEVWKERLSDIAEMSHFIDDMAAKIKKSARENYKIWWTNLDIDYDYWIEEMKGILADRISYLNTIYNNVDVLPASKNYGTIAYNYSASAVSPQTFTLVSYGEMTSLIAVLQEGASSSPFEITSDLTQTPTGKGGYLATISVKPKDDLPAGAHSDVLTLSGVNQGNPFTLNVPLNFTVSPMSVASASFTLSQTEGYVYDGTAKIPEVSDVVLDGITLRKDTDYTIAYTDNVNAGTAMVTVNGINNYSGEASKTFTIDKAALDITNLTIQEKVYDGSVAAIVTAITFDGLQDGDALVLGTDFTAVAEFNSADVADANTIDAEVSLLGTVAANNYRLSENMFTSSGHSISKATIVGVPQTLDVKHMLSQGYEFDMAQLLPDVSPLTLGAVSYSPAITSNANDVLGTLDYTSGNVLTIPVNAAATNLAAEITVTVSSGNYENFTATVTVETTDKTPIVISAFMSGGEYSGAPYAHGNIGMADNDGNVVTGITPVILYESTDGGGYSGASAPVNAGAYRLTLSVPSTDPIYKGIAAFNFTIAPKPVTIAAENKTAKMGGVMPSFTYNVDGFLGNDGLTTEPVLSCGTDMMTAGNHEIIVTGGAASGNYTLVRQSGTLTVIQTYLVTVSSSGAGASGSGRRYAEGETVRVSAGTPPKNHRFTDWTTADPGVSFANIGSLSTSFPMPPRAVVVTAEWEWHIVPVADILNVPKTMKVGVPLELTGTVMPSDATNRVISWSLAAVGDVGASLSGNTLTVSEAGEVIVIATVDSGAVAGAEYMDFTQVFVITVEPAVAVASPDERVIPQVKPDEEVAVVYPIDEAGFKFTVGPNPVSKSTKEVGFFVDGTSIRSGTLIIYDVMGNVIRRINVDAVEAAVPGRPVATWDLSDAKGRPVARGTYLARGIINTIGGRKEKVSVVVRVQ